MAKREGITTDQMTNDLIAASSFGLCVSFVIRHSCFVIPADSNLFSVSRFPTLTRINYAAPAPRLRARRPLQVLFRFRGLVAVLRPPWHRPVCHHDLDHDEKAAVCGLPRRAPAKRRWKLNRAPIRREFRTLHRCIAHRESRCRCPLETRPGRFALLSQSFSPAPESCDWILLSGEIDTARGPAGKRVSRRWGADDNQHKRRDDLQTSRALALCPQRTPSRLAS